MQTNLFKKCSLIALVFTITILASSCSKQSSTGNPQYYMRFKANGNQVTFTTGAQAAFSNNGNIYVCTLSGFDANSNMNIILTDTTAIKANNTYTEQIVPSLGNSYVLMAYQDKNKTSYISQNPLADASVDAKTTLTDISTDYVKGTFSGKIINGNNTLLITEGEFILKRAN